MPSPSACCLVASAETIRHRITSSLLDGFSQWWQMPAAAAAAVALACFVVWTYRRDAAGLPRGVAALLALLRLGVLAAVVVTLLDFERTTEHEIVSPSRVAVLVDTSASMTLADGGAAESPPRAARAAAVLEEGGLLEALAARHEVSVWRFDADAERLVTLPSTAGQADGGQSGDWRERLAAQGYETALGEALARVLDQEPRGVLAGAVVLSDGANNAGLDPAAAATALEAAEVPVHVVGIGSETAPANVRVADLVAPSRVFPGDRFAVTAYLQAQGLAGRTVRVELAESAADDPAAAPRPIDAIDIVLAADGDLAAARFDVPGLSTRGRRGLLARVVPPPADRTTADDSQLAEIEVVDRVTQVLLMAGGPTREYQFLRNVLERDRSFAVDILLGTAVPGISQDARRILDAFPASDEALGSYDAIVAFDPDWRRLDAATVGRLERWVARESGGLVLVAGPVFMDAWLADPIAAAVRSLFPVELGRQSRLGGPPSAAGDPLPLVFTRDGQDAEFLWLAASRVSNQTVWSEFRGVYSCWESAGPKPGATVYARVDRSGPQAPGEANPVYMAGQYYGSGSTFFVGSGELWRLRAIDDAVYERLVTQLVRHVAQGRLLRGSRRTRLLVDRDRFPVGASVGVRVVLAEGNRRPVPPACRVIGPDGVVAAVPLAADPGRSGTLQGGFVVTRPGTWQIDLDPGDDAGEGRVSRRILARLPDRELARPTLDRAGLERLCAATGGGPHFPGDAGWSTEDSRRLADLIPDRSRRDYEAGAPDDVFKRRLNTGLMTAAIGLLCLEWIIRRVVRLS